MTMHRCESCAMPIDAGRFCRHCSDENGNLQSFEARFEGMSAFFMGQDPSLDRAEAERRTRDYMANMPAWKDHPKLKGH
jgi:hypothetical protein